MLGEFRFLRGPDRFFVWRAARAVMPADSLWVAAKEDRDWISTMHAANGLFPRPIVVTMAERMDEGAWALVQTAVAGGCLAATADGPWPKTITSSAIWQEAKKAPGMVMDFAAPGEAAKRNLLLAKIREFGVEIDEKAENACVDLLIPLDGQACDMAIERMLLALDGKRRVTLPDMHNLCISPDAGAELFGALRRVLHGTGDLEPLRRAVSADPIRASGGLCKVLGELYALATGVLDPSEIHYRHRKDAVALSRRLGASKIGNAIAGCIEAEADLRSFAIGHMEFAQRACAHIEQATTESA